ncbi:F-box protein [Salix suchowensis]|nr:F-box protein [Salix suchowensis]
MDDNPRRRKSSSETPILPSCLIMDILSRLPIKTILNCRRVCKTWLHFISDSFFTELHLERSPTSLLIKTISNNPESRNLQLVQITGKPTGLRFRAVEEMKFVPGTNLPCNDFLLNTLDIYVCNPILGEYISIPLAAGQETRHQSNFALGYSAITREYKVLHTFCSKTGSDFQPEAQIYTIATGKWRSIHKALRNLDIFMFDSFVGGSIHWELRDEGNCVNSIGSFNFENEQFSQFSLPPRYNEELVTLTVFEGCLGVSFFSTCLQPQYEIWVMKEYGKKESWTKLITVENPGFGELCEPLIFLNSGLILMMHCREYVVCYDTRTRFMEAIRIWQAQGNSYAMPYKPSFVSLKDVAKGEQLKMSSTMLSPVTAIQQEKDGLAETSWKVLLS